MRFGDYFSNLTYFYLGIQNIGIAFLVLLYSFPEPENYQSTVIIMIILYVSSLPFFAKLLIDLIRNKFCKKEIVEDKKTLEDDTNLSEHMAELNE